MNDDLTSEFRKVLLDSEGKVTLLSRACEAILDAERSALWGKQLKD